MGQLKPDATYIYERADGVTYAREFGALPNERFPIGWDYRPDDPNFDPRTSDGRPLHDHLMEDKLWGDVRREARTNPVLRDALDRAILIYHLSKKDGTE